RMSPVITVPAYFNDAQHQATKDAGSMAGLTILRISMNPPPPPSPSVPMTNSPGADESHFVIDLGGGTFDFSLV
ncbi:hypothetical protein M407DRAFT_37926, partial [Tulasnella calospora MUT 4182]